MIAEALLPTVLGVVQGDPLYTYCGKHAVFDIQAGYSRCEHVL